MRTVRSAVEVPAAQARQAGAGAGARGDREGFSAKPASWAGGGDTHQEEGGRSVAPTPVPPRRLPASHTMISPLRCALGALAALCALSGQPLGAQSVIEFGGERVSVPWTPSQGTFGRSVHGLLTPGAGRDVVVLVGATPFVLVDADPYDAKVELALTANDVAVLAGGAPGGRDALVSVGPAGVQLTWYGDEGGAFVTQTLAAGAWSDARLVRALDVDGDGAPDLVGVAADGSTLLALLAQAQPLSFTAAADSDVGVGVRDLCALQWDGDAALELALLTDLGVEVRDGNGALLDTWLATLPGGAIARVRQTGMSTDRIAWITAYAPPALQYLMTLAPGGAVHDLVDLGALDAFAAVGGDYDLDGDDDLLVSHHYSNELIWFENERSPQFPTAPSFLPVSPSMRLFRVGPPGAGAASNFATPVRADLDGDGDLDLLYACQTSGTIEILRGETVDQNTLKPEVVDGLWRPEATPEQGELVLEVAPPAVVPPAATHARVQVWQRAGAGAEFEPQAVAQVLVDLTQPWPAQLAIPLDETTPAFDATYGIEIKLVRIDAQGAVVTEFPASLWEFMSNEFTLQDLLDEVPGSLAQPIPTESSIPSTADTSVVMRRPKLGAYKQGQVPNV